MFACIHSYQALWLVYLYSSTLYLITFVTRLSPWLHFLIFLVKKKWGLNIASKSDDQWHRVMKGLWATERHWFSFWASWEAIRQFSLMKKMVEFQFKIFHFSCSFDNEMKRPREEMGKQQEMITLWAVEIVTVSGHLTHIWKTCCLQQDCLVAWTYRMAEIVELRKT